VLKPGVYSSVKAVQIEVFDVDPILHNEKRRRAAAVSHHYCLYFPPTSGGGSSGTATGP
jgi:hypothetical protein